MVDERRIEGRVVNHDLSALNKVEKRGRDLGKARFVGKELPRQTVHLNRAVINIAFRVDVLMEVSSRQPATNDFDRADLDDSMSELRLQARGFGVEHHLTHH